MTYYSTPFVWAQRYFTPTDWARVKWSDRRILLSGCWHKTKLDIYMDPGSTSRGKCHVKFVGRVLREQIFWAALGERARTGFVPLEVSVVGSQVQ